MRVTKREYLLNADVATMQKFHNLSVIVNGTTLKFSMMDTTYASLRGPAVRKVLYVRTLDKEPVVKLILLPFDVLTPAPEGWITGGKELWVAGKKYRIILMETPTKYDLGQASNLIHAAASVIPV